MKRVVRTKSYRDDLDRIEARIAQDNPTAGSDMWLHIDEQVDGLLSADLLMTISGLDAHLGWWRTLTCARQRVLVNMAFNLGVAGLLGFKNTLSAVQRGHYEQAASGMMASKWAQQVGARADRLAVMMRTG